MTKTIRQTIVELLKEEALSTRDLAEILDIREKETFNHLEHIARSVSPKNRLVIKPAQCKKCGFLFKKRSRVTPPSRCPQCKSELIERPRFSIV